VGNWVQERFPCCEGVPRGAWALGRGAKRRGMRTELENELRDTIAELRDEVDELKKELGGRPYTFADEFPDRKVCSKCKHYMLTEYYGCKTQLMSGKCIDCYSAKVYILRNYRGEGDPPAAGRR
jgi:hypothetical protein